MSAHADHDHEGHCACGQHHEHSAAAGDSVPEVRVKNHDGLEVSARAGKMDLGGLAALAISAVWCAFWLLALTSAGDDAPRDQAAQWGPEVIVPAIAALLGVYCAGLVLWSMFGRMRVVIRRDRLRVSTPWLFGALMGKYDLALVTPFSTSDKDCAAHSDGCCCSYSSVDYKLTFGYDGRQVSVFSHLTRDAKDFLRDRLNQALPQAPQG